MKKKTLGRRVIQFSIEEVMTNQELLTQLEAFFRSY